MLSLAMFAGGLVVVALGVVSALSLALGASLSSTTPGVLPSAGTGDQPNGLRPEQAAVAPASAPPGPVGHVAHAMSHPSAYTAANDATWKRPCAPCGALRRILGIRA